MEQIKNEHLTIGISAHGAELQSIKDSDGKEYLWQANPSIWDVTPLFFSPLFADYGTTLVALMARSLTCHAMDLHATPTSLWWLKARKRWSMQCMKRRNA